VAPKFQIGVEVAGCGVMAGVGDLRDGISLFASVHARIISSSSGKSWKELFSNFRTNLHDVPGIGGALESAQKVVGGEDGEVTKLLKENGVDVNASTLLEEKRTGAFEGIIKASSGIGISAKVCPGWKDADGYRNIGGGASMDMGVELNFDLVVGLRTEHKPAMCRILLGLCNFMFQITFPL